MSFDYKDYLVIKKQFLRSKSKSGVRQLKLELEQNEGLIFNRKKIWRIMKKYGLETKIRRKSKYRKFLKDKAEHEVAPNLVDRKFTRDKVNQVYSIDITQINYNNKKAYVAAIKDLCSKDIVAKTVSNRIDLDLTNKTIRKAIRKLTKEERKLLMVHSDQGTHFTHKKYRKILKRHKITQSMSRRGNCIDNAPIESFFGTLKDLADFKECKNIRDIEKEVTKQINYYNYRRPQLGLKKMPPKEYRRHIS